MITRILIDLDDTLYDIDTPWYSRYNNDYPHHPIKVEDILDWDVYKYVAPECGKKIYDYLSIPEIYLEGQPHPNSQEVTQNWVNLGYEVGIITSAAHINAATPKLQWVKQNFPHLYNNTHIVTGHTKHWCNADFIIDDGPHNLEHFNGVKLLYNQPWNRNVDKYVRVYDWIHIDLIIRTGIQWLNRGFSVLEIEGILRRLV